ncbi:MAG: hypothetical protein RI946_1586, partial [Pseudomonadota bacterium]
ASVGMAAALFALSFGADPYVQTTLMRVGLAVALMVLGMALYSGLAQMLGAVNFRRLKADLLRRN